MHKDRVSSLLHLYEDGALNRRELIRRLTQATGSAAAALAAIESAGLANAQPAMCPAGVKVAESDPDIRTASLTLHGEGGPLFAYQALPADYASARRPAVLVVHENRGLTEHIKDVTRRVAKAGYVGIGVDLLSRQGGSHQFVDPEQLGAAYNRTVQAERTQDMLSALLTIREQVYVQGDRLGAVGFCAGGANVLDLAMNFPALTAAAMYYGPIPERVDVSAINARILGLYGERDTFVTPRVASLLTALITANKRYELHVYENVGHAFHNDTGASYNATAACDAWSKTLAFFQRHLNAPAVPL